MTRRTLIVWAGCLACFAASPLMVGCAEVGSQDPQPPIIVIDIDTLRQDHLSGYGYARNTSPHLDAWMAGGVRFEEAYSQAPNTLPSQTSIFTSLYPTTHGAVKAPDRMPDRVVTLAEALSAAGYETAAFTGGGLMSAEFGHDQGFDVFETARKGLAASVPKALAWVRERQHERFFLLIHTYDVHTPYEPAEPYRSMFLDGLAAPTPGFEPGAKRMEQIRRSKSTDHRVFLPENDLAYAEALYDAGIREADEHIGAFLAGLGPLADRAIIVLISDHGEEFQEHGSLLHDRLYPTVTRIPFVIRLPGLGVGRVVPQTVQGIDLMPTLLELVGAEIPAEAEGRSLVPLLSGAVLPELAAFGESPFWGGRRSVVREGWQLVRTVRPGDAIGKIVGVPRAELFELHTDPHALDDLLREQPEQRGALAALLDRQQRELEGSGSAPVSAELDDATRHRLRALGYLD